MGGAIISAPASSGNIGPGFDTLALAFDLRCVVEAVAAPQWTITEQGATKQLDDHDLIARAVAAAVVGPMHLTVDNDIPRARGLGSSSAVAAAAAAAAMLATGAEVDRLRVFDIVTDLEGHGDNAAAAVFGGLTAVSGGRIARLDLHPTIIPIVAVPDERLSTKQARAALPQHVGRSAVVRSLGRMVFLVEGLRRGDRELLAAARGDELHEEPRSTLSPITGDLLAAAFEAGALHAAWSGAGPAVLALVSSAERDVVLGALRSVLGDAGSVMEPGLDRSGLTQLEDRSRR
jgi:homoserine kinase